MLNNKWIDIFYQRPVVSWVLLQIIFFLLGYVLALKTNWQQLTQQKMLARQLVTEIKQLKNAPQNSGIVSLNAEPMPNLCKQQPVEILVLLQGMTERAKKMGLKVKLLQKKGQLIHIVLLGNYSQLNSYLQQTLLSSCFLTITQLKMNREKSNLILDAQLKIIRI